MANDGSRAQAMLEIADILDKGDQPTQAAGKLFANQIRKYVAMVGERDAGPSDKLKEENTKLVARNQELEAAVSMLKVQTEDYKVMRESAIRNQRSNEGLRESNTQLAKRNQELVKKHDEMVDRYAEADQRATANKKALDDMVASQVVPAPEGAR